MPTLAIGATESRVTDPLLTCESVLAETAFHLQSVSLVIALIVEGLITVAFDCSAQLPQLAALAKRYAISASTAATSAKSSPLCFQWVESATLDGGNSAHVIVDRFAHEYLRCAARSSARTCARQSSYCSYENAGTLYFPESCARFLASPLMRAARRERRACAKAGSTAACAMCPRPTIA